MSLNKAIIIGRLGKDPELSYTQSGTARCRLSVATSEVYFDRNNERQEKTDWHNVVVWGKQAESAGKYLEKGREVCVEGKIETRSWEDQNTGQKKWITEIKAMRVIFLGGGNKGGQGRQGSGDQGGGGYQGGGGPSGGGDQGGGGGGNHGAGDYPDDDIPF